MGGYSSEPTEAFVGKTRQVLSLVQQTEGSDGREPDETHFLPWSLSLVDSTGFVIQRRKSTEGSNPPHGFLHFNERLATVSDEVDPVIGLGIKYFSVYRAEVPKRRELEL